MNGQSTSVQEQVPEKLSFINTEGSLKNDSTYFSKMF